MSPVSQRKWRPYYGWVVVAGLLAICVVMFGTRFSFGVFFKSLEGEFDLSRALTSGVYSAYWLIGIVFVVGGGWAADRYGARAVMLVMGAFTGLSMVLTGMTSAGWQLFTN